MMRLQRLSAAVAILAATLGHGLEADFRAKWFTTVGTLPSHDAQRQLLGTPSIDNSADFRSLIRHRIGNVNLLVDHNVVLFSGANAELQTGPDSSLDQTVTNDARRWVDLTWELEDGNRHQSFHRLDRLALQWQTGDWSVTLGRQAVTWGSGIVFQPLDLFSPFSPTVVDRDYKPGDDLLLVDRLLANGQDLQLLHIARRDEQGDVSADVASTALRWHGFAAGLELEAIAGQHFDEQVFGFTFRVPLGAALLRSDLLATRLDSGQWRLSGIVNADVTVLLGGRTTYLFAEYYHNDFGVSELPDNPALLPQSLQQRLGRGEVFNLQRDYLAIGGSYDWHPLLNQSATVLTSVDDRSSLLQIQFSYEPGDHQALEVGWIEPLGRAGDEFGGIPLAGDALTAGGGGRGYLRWAYFF